MLFGGPIKCRPEEWETYVVSGQAFGICHMILAYECFQLQSAEALRSLAPAISALAIGRRGNPP